jgi:hypothetical protein
MAARPEDGGGRFTKSVKFLGIEFAPFFLPFERRLQVKFLFSFLGWEANPGPLNFIYFLIVTTLPLSHSGSPQVKNF